MIGESGVRIVRGNKPKSSSGGLTIAIMNDNKGKRDIIGTNKAIYIKTWKENIDIRVNNTNLKKACFNVAYMIRDFNEKDKEKAEV